LTNISGFDIISKELLGYCKNSDKSVDFLTFKKNPLIKRLSDDQNSVISSESDLEQTNAQQYQILQPEIKPNTLQSFSSKNSSLKRLLLKKNLAIQFSKQTPKVNSSLSNYNYKENYGKHARDKFTAILCKSKNDKSSSKLSKGTLDSDQSKDYKEKFLPYRNMLNQFHKQFIS